MNRRMFLCLALVLSGCQVHEESHTNAIQHDRRKYVVAILMDTSGSFQSLMFGQDGRAYEFCMETAKDFREEIGDDGTVLLAQLSGNDDPLLWEGTPQQLMSSFSSAENLRDFIRSKSDPNASRLFGGLADAMAYLRGVSGPDTILCVVVLTDLIDNSPTQKEDRKRLVEELRRFNKPQNCIGMYYLATKEMQVCRELFAEAGLDGAAEGKIVHKPKRLVFGR